MRQFFKSVARIFVTRFFVYFRLLLITKLSEAKTHSVNFNSSALKNNSKLHPTFATSINSLLKFKRQAKFDCDRLINVVKFNNASSALISSGIKTRQVSTKVKNSSGLAWQPSMVCGWVKPRNRLDPSAPFPPMVLKWPWILAIPLESSPYKLPSVRLFATQSLLKKNANSRTNSYVRTIIYKKNSI